MTKIRFVVGPPGTGKTHIFLINKYKELLKKYDIEKIILTSHTNVASDQIKKAILELPEVKSRGLRKKFFDYRVCTIHKYCRSKNPGSDVWVGICDDHFENLCMENINFKLGKHETGKELKKTHGFFKCYSDAHGKGLTLKEHYNTCSPHVLQEYKPYNLRQIEHMEETYEKYKQRNRISDFADMIDKYNNQNDESDIQALIIDEAQDCNVPQLKAVKKMGANVRDGHLYMVGDPDQTIFEFSGSDADAFHKNAAQPWQELTEGLRCSKVVNAFARKIIKPLWTKYGYERVWTPTKDEGNIIRIQGLKSPSLNLDKLIHKIKNTEETFIFTYRGNPTNHAVRKFFIQHGIVFAHINSSPHVPVKELRAHKNYDEVFLKGKPLELKYIKQFHNYLGRKVVVHGKTGKTLCFDEMIDKPYTIHELIKADIYKPEILENGNFHIVRTGANIERIAYIKKVLSKGFNFAEDKVRVEYGNIHEIKGITRDNCVFDTSVYPFRYSQEPRDTQIRLSYTAVTRARYDLFIIQSSLGATLGGVK